MTALRDALVDMRYRGAALRLTGLFGLRCKTAEM
jgi:hypothetical protein